MSTQNTNALGGIREKLKRVSEQIDTVDQEVRRLLAGGQYRVTGLPDHELRQYSFKAYGSPLPFRFSVITGEVVHHLRSCLDHLVWQLVLVNGEKPTERNEFPICTTREKFTEACKRGKIRGVSGNAEQRIESPPALSCTPTGRELAVGDS